MSHEITAILLLGPWNEAGARAFELQSVSLPQDLTLFPISVYLIEYWGVRTGNRKRGPCPVMMLFPTDDVLFDIVESLQPNARFAVIRTEYFGGIGSQAGAVFHGRSVVMPPCSNGINAALRHLGVEAAPGLDEFDTVGLDRHRAFHEVDDRDWDAEYAKLGLERP